MPVVIRKIKNKNLYSVKDPVKGKTHAKATTLTKAKNQKKLLDYISKKKESG